MSSLRNDYVHFTGRRKPWFHGPPANLTKESSLDSGSHFWYYQLEQLNDEHDMGINFTGWGAHDGTRRPLLGMSPLYGDVLTSNTNLGVGTKVEDGNDRRTVPVVTETASDHATGMTMETSVTHTRTSKNEPQSIEAGEGNSYTDTQRRERMIERREEIDIKVQRMNRRRKRNMERRERKQRIETELENE
jgi:hypothetical protein